MRVQAWRGSPCLEVIIWPAWPTWMHRWRQPSLDRILQTMRKCLLLLVSAASSAALVTF